VACRGSVALRVIAACRRRGWSPVAVVAAADQQRPHGAAADACVEVDAYDDVGAIVAAASEHRVDLVHPGAGALAENPDLPAGLAAAGVRLVGPSASALAVASDKERTVAAAERLGIAVLPHTTVRSMVDGLGLPLVVKPARGCLGAGVRVVRERADLEPALAACPGWYAERYLDRARAVAVTVATDAAGQLCDLGERETLLLAGSRKLLDASPVTTVPARTLAWGW
jgi:biotin carboxylase